MRIARCTGDIQLQLLGSRESVSIGRDSQIDLDQVIGESDGRPVTIEEALGPHIVHFDIQAPPALDTQDPPALMRRGRNQARETAPVQE